MHGIAEKQSLPDARFFQRFLNLRRDVDKSSASGDVEYQFLSVTLHNCKSRVFPEFTLDTVRNVTRIRQKASMILQLRLDFSANC